MDSAFTGSHAATSDAAFLTAPADYEETYVHRARRTLGFVFLVCAAILLTLTGCDSEGMLTADSSERDTALRILQVDSRMLAFADVDDQVDVALQMMGDNAEAQEMMDEALEHVFEMTGIRVEEDVHSVYMSISDFSDDARAGVVAFVDFDQDMVVDEATSMDDVVRLDTDWPVDAFTVEGHEGDAAVAFAEGSLIMMATHEGHLVDMLDRAYEEGGAVAIDPLLSEVADRNSWMVVRGISDYTNEMASAEMQGEMALLLPLMTSLENVAVGAYQDMDAMSSVAIIQPTSAVSVDDYASLLSGVRAMMRLQFRDMDVAMEMVDQIDIEAHDEWVSLEIDLDREDLERLEEEIREEMGARFD